MQGVFTLEFMFWFCTLCKYTYKFFFVVFYFLFFTCGALSNFIFFFLFFFSFYISLILWLGQRVRYHFAPSRSRERMEGNIFRSATGMQQAKTVEDETNQPLSKGVELMTYDSYDFGMLAIDVVLGDGTRCMLDFAESLYLGRLLSMRPPVVFSFGSATAMRELEKIVALLHGTRHTGSSYATDECDSGLKNASMRCHRMADAAAGRGMSASAAPSAELSASDRIAVVRAYVRQMSENRRLFMDVLELAARLEMEETFPLLCEEFSFIFENEVRGKFTKSLFLLQELGGSGQMAIKTFRKIVMQAFALDGVSPVPATREEERQPRPSNCDEVAHHWLKQLREDHYFFPGGQLIGDLTQSVDPETSVWHDETPFGDEFTPSFQRYPFHSPVWEPGDTAKTCPVCGMIFASWSMLSLNTVRPSHCRCCGRRICARCTSWQLDKSIAKLNKPGVPEEGQLRRACKECFDKAEKLNKHAFLCEIFVLAGLTLTDIALLRSINPHWKGASELCLSDYRSSLYQHASWKLAVATQTARILASSVNILVGHPESIIFLFISMDWSNEKLVKAAYSTLEKTLRDAASQGRFNHASTLIWRPPVSHWHMLCTRACGLMLPSFFAIKMLECLHRAPEAHPTAELMRMMVTKELLLGKEFHLDSRVCECVIMLLLDIFELKTCQPHVTSVLLRFSAQERRLALMISQETFTRCRYDELGYQTLRGLVIDVDCKERPETHEHFLNTLRFLDVLRSVWADSFKQNDISRTRELLYKNLRKAGLLVVSREVNETTLINRHTISPILFPFDTSVVLNKIDFGGIVAMHSKQRPVLIPLIDERGETRCILYKNENLEKDKVMCIASRFLQWVLYKQLRHVVLPTYHVMPLSSSSGIIEIVKDGHTVQSVIEPYKEHRLLQYLQQLEQQYAQQEEERHVKKQREATASLQESARSSSVNVRENFLCSAKFFILMNYIFAIGDRHRDNVMVHPSGAIFHIDFGMLLNARTLAERVTTSYVRFDLDLEECVLEFMRDEKKKTSRGPFSSLGPPPNPPTLPQEQGSLPHVSTHSPDDSLSRFLMEAADWFLEVRPYASILCQLLSHVLFRQALDGVRSVEQLTALMHTIFMRDAAEETCKTLFCDRVRQSRGQTWLKDLTHDTQKRTWFMVSQGLKWIREKTGLDRLDTPH
ncbi:phosphatidylinositol 3-kinase (tor2), putative [Trypanosoma cruzi marinkellei]|uniref:Phosphatidylinositol 3-kinase (Tor2), putative n=1 Tax=Trypanosoma cruzi marinkellei TaxID=85056 RepID=K2MDL4_TRYCR|nr:phosphatidylinositol 3-kinase (tor2), putative [Trypanosoma cruzi marinkellei]